MRSQSYSFFPRPASFSQKINLNYPWDAPSSIFIFPQSFLSFQVGKRGVTCHRRGRKTTCLGRFGRKSATFGGQMTYSRRAEVAHSTSKSATVGVQKWHFCFTCPPRQRPQNRQPAQNQQDRRNAPESRISDKNQKVFGGGPCRGRFFS